MNAKAFLVGQFKILIQRNEVSLRARRSHHELAAREACDMCNVTPQLLPDHIPSDEPNSQPWWKYRQVLVKLLRSSQIPCFASPGERTTEAPLLAGLGQSSFCLGIDQ